LKAPLIAVISVGVAAATPAVAISARTPDDGGRAAEAVAPVKTDLRQPPGLVTIQDKTKVQLINKHQLQRRLRILRNRANRLVAKRDHRRPRFLKTTVQPHWSNQILRKAIRTLKKRIRRLRAALRHRSGLAAGVRAILDRIAACESKGNPRAIGGGGAFRGKYQFTYGTWYAVGGRGDPASASEAEQDRRAAMLLARSGSSPWPVCG
jgi:hypothetical protein